jgi:hypothetical protein
MAESFLDEMFQPPKLESGDRIVRKDAGILGRKRGTVVSAGGWYAVVQWDGLPKPRREFIPDLEIDNS